jgi:hypothetical protein
MKSVVFWDMTPYGSCKNRRFGGMHRLRRQDEKNQRAHEELLEVSLLILPMLDPAKQEIS